MRPAMSHLLQQYLVLLRSSPKYARVLTAAVFCTVLGGLYEKRRRARLRAIEERRGSTLVRRNSALKLTDGLWPWFGGAGGPTLTDDVDEICPGTRVIYVPTGSTTAKVVLRPTKATTFDAHRRLFLEPPGGRNFRRAGGDAPPLNTKPGLNLAFLHQLLSLLSIMIPRLTSKESFLLLLHAGFLVFRTYISLVVARLDGEIVRDLVAGNGKAFSWGIVKWLGIGAPAVYCNAMVSRLGSLEDETDLGKDQIPTGEDIDCVPHPPNEVYTRPVPQRLAWILQGHEPGRRARGRRRRPVHHLRPAALLRQCRGAVLVTWKAVPGPGRFQLSAVPCPRPISICGYHGQLHWKRLDVAAPEPAVWKACGNPGPPRGRV